MQTQSTQRDPLPLCAGYYGVMLDRLDLRDQGHHVRMSHTVQWAIGLLADGELELLGAWLSPRDDAGLEQLFAELRDRGVEAVRFVVCPDPAVIRVDALAAYPRGAVLPSLEALRRQSLLQVAPSHRRTVGSGLRLLIAAESLDSAVVALKMFAARGLGRKYPALVDRWHRALLDMEPFFALGSRQRRMLSIGDDLVQNFRGRLRRSLSRPGPLPSSAKVSSLIEASLARIGHRLPTHKTTLGSDVVGYSVRPIAGALAASP